MKTKALCVISVVLSLLMIMLVFSLVTVSATTYGGTDVDNGISWEYDDETKTLEVTGSGAYPDYQYPNNEPWFEYAHDVKVLELGYGFTSIPAHAFETVYTDLEEVVLPGSMLSIGDQAFSNCEELESIDFGGTQEIGASAFNYTNLKSVELSYTVKTIGDSAFSDNPSLTSVSLGEVETIGASAFSDTGLKSVTIPDSVKTIGKHAFGYYYDEPDDGEGTTSLYGWYPLKHFEIHASEDNAVAYMYAMKNGFTLCTGSASISPKSVSLKADATKKITVKNAAVTSWTTSDKKVAIVKSGTVYALKKGTTKITATTVTGKKLTSTVKVTSNPSIKIGGKAYKSGKTYSVNKGRKIAVKITGKSSKANNAYSSSKSKIAKVISKKTVTTAYIKGYKKGTTTIKITVNGVVFKFKVKVK